MSFVIFFPRVIKSQGSPIRIIRDPPNGILPKMPQRAPARAKMRQRAPKCAGARQNTPVHAELS